MTQSLLQFGIVYHIYNRGNNGENIFVEKRNYNYFLNLYGKYIAPIVDTFAYCLLKNHFHFSLRIKERSSIMDEHGSFKEPCSLNSDWLSQQFATFFGTYTKAINNVYARTGTLFEGRFKRIPVTEDGYFCYLIAYIHQNPQRHGFVDDYRDWPYSSYRALCGRGTTRLARDEALSWFGGVKGFLDFHDSVSDFQAIEVLVGGDFF